MVLLHFQAYFDGARVFRVAVLCLVATMAAIAPSALAAWNPVGPDGGDARAIASVPGQPSHLYLGTVNSLIYESRDEGATWHRLGKTGFHR